LREHIGCLFEKDGWAFSLIYVITFGGFIGLASFLPTYFYDQFKVSKVEAGQLTMLATLMGSAVRVVGGYAERPHRRRPHAQRRAGAVGPEPGGLRLRPALAGRSPPAASCCASRRFGAGNGALFQLVPLRWPLSTAVAGSMIGEVGALGGGFIPNAMGQSIQHSGSYLWGFLAFALLALVMLAMLRVVQIRWTRTWAEKGGRARVVPAQADEEPVAYQRA
jgi:NNP family nitrate/nitrite transporter-like MFS transporter